VQGAAETLRPSSLKRNQCSRFNDISCDGTNGLDVCLTPLLHAPKLRLTGRSTQSGIGGESGHNTPACWQRITTACLSAASSRLRSTSRSDCKNRPRVLQPPPQHGAICAASSQLIRGGHPSRRGCGMTGTWPRDNIQPAVKRAPLLAGDVSALVACQNKVEATHVHVACSLACCMCMCMRMSACMRMPHHDYRGYGACRLRHHYRL